METVEVHGLRLAYRRTGNGPPVMFVHGGVEDSRSWTPQLDALSDEFTVIAWDEPGAGGSQDVPDEFGLSDYADCLAATIRALVGSPTPVVGLSWGTTVILEVYRRHPAVVRSMVLADGYAGWRGRWARRRQTPGWPACARRWLSRTMHSIRPCPGSSLVIHPLSSYRSWRRWRLTSDATAC